MADDASRLDLLRTVDGQLAELDGLIGASHAVGIDTAQTTLLQEAAANLAALRSQIETVGSPSQLASLRLTVASAVRSAGSAIVSAASGVTTQQQLAAKLYDTRMSAAERGMAEVSRRDDMLFAAADGRAAQLGLDVGFFRDQRQALEAEAAVARKRGDRFGALVPEGLLAHNTANLWDEIADRTNSPEDRKKAEDSRRLAEEADRRVREAAQAEATRAAAGRPFATEAERDRWIAADAGQNYAKYQQRVATLRPAGSQAEQRATLATAHAAFTVAAEDVSSSDRPDEAAGGLASSLPASVREAACEAARPIVHCTTPAAADDERPIAPVTPAKKLAVKASPGSSVTF